MNTIRLSRSDLGQGEKTAVCEVLDDGYLGMGPKVLEFEISLAKFFSRPVVCVSSGTAALHLALQAIGVGPEDEVIVPDITYVATLQAISASGAKPVICDIETESISLSIDTVERMITTKTKAIIIVHYAGMPAIDYDRLLKLSNERGITLIEDAAHAFGTRVNNELIGARGHITCFSFDGIKNITCGEGGCIVTDNQDVIKKVSDARLLGVENDTLKRFQGERSLIFDVKQQGWRYHMQNANAAIGLIQLNRLEQFRQTKYLLWKNYHKQILGKLSNICVPVLPAASPDILPHIYPILLNDPNNVEKLIRLFKRNKIQYGRHYQPNSSLTFYKNKNHICPIAAMYFNRSITLPFHTLLTEQEQSRIIETMLQLQNEI